MVFASSEEEVQLKEEADTVAPAALERQEDVDSTVDDGKKKLIEEASMLLGSWRTRCSEMLEAARRGRVTGDLELRCLDFLEKELSLIVAGLTALSPQHVDEEIVRCQRELTDDRAPYIIPWRRDPQRQNPAAKSRAVLPPQASIYI